MINRKKLLEELLDVGEVLALAEETAAKALEQVAILRRHYHARLDGWQEALKLEVTPERVPPSLTDHDGDGNTAADAAAERHGVVASALRRAEENRDVCLDIGKRIGEGAELSVSIEKGDRPGREIRIPAPSPEDSQTQPIPDIPGPRDA